MNQTETAVRILLLGCVASMGLALESQAAPQLIDVPSNVTVTCGQIPAPANVMASSSCALPVAPTNGLLLYYSFDSGGASNVVDQSGNGHAGRLYGGAQVVSNAGRLGGALSLDGTNDMLFATGTLQSAAMTVCAWTWERSRKSGSGDPAYAHAIYSANPVNGFNELVSDSGVLTYAISGGNAWRGSGALLPLTNWTHIALSRTTDGVVRLYRNGSLVHTGAEAVAPIPLVPFCLGAWITGTNFAGLKGYFAGLFDEVRVYGRALASNEVEQLAGGSTTSAVSIAFLEAATGSCPQVIARVWTATDICGESASATQTITVVDDSAPVLAGVPTNAVIWCGQSLPLLPSVTAMDECGPVPVVFSEATSGACPGTVTRTWTATDTCGNQATASQLITIKAAHGSGADFDGDAMSDITTYWPAGGTWNALRSSGPGYTSVQLGSTNMVAVAADYDGDQHADFAVYHAANGTWNILQSSSNGALRQIQWGWSQAVPVPADFDGDGSADIATYVPASGQWSILQSSNRTGVFRQWGWSQAIPVVADYDGDGKADLATYVPSSGRWSIRQSSTGQGRFADWGWSQAMPVPADYDGDRKADLATYVPAEGNWYISQSSLGGALKKTQWGWMQAAPVPADYDGDGRADIATYHPPTGLWYILKSSGGMRQQQWGWSQAVPVTPQFQVNRRYFPSP